MVPILSPLSTCPFGKIDSVISEKIFSINRYLPINFCQLILNILLEYENGHDLQINETIRLRYEDNPNIMLLNNQF